MRFSNHRYMGKIFQCLQKKLRRSSLNPTLLIWRTSMTSTMKAAMRISWRLRKSTRTKSENIFGVYSTFFGCWSKNIPTKFWMWDVLIFDHHHGRDQSMMKQQPNGRRRLLRHQCPRYWSRSCASLGLVGSEGAWAGSGSASSARGRTRGERAWVSPLPACSGPPAGSEYRGKSHSQGHKGRQASLGECQMGLARHGLGAEEAVRHCVGEHRTRGTAQQGPEPIQCAEGTSSKSWVSAAGQRAHFGVFGQSSTLSSGISCSWRCVRDSRCHQDIRCSDGIWRCHSVQKCLGWRCLWGLQGHDVGVWEETRVVSGTTVISVQKPTPQTAPPSEPPTQGGRSASRKKNLWGRSPSGKFARQPCRDYFKGFCTKSPCGYDIFLSVNSVNLNRDANSVITAHLHRKVEEQPNRKPKRACDVKSWNHRISTLHRSETKMASMKEPFDDKRKARQQFCHS